MVWDRMTLYMTLAHSAKPIASETWAVTVSWTLADRQLTTWYSTCGEEALFAMEIEDLTGMKIMVVGFNISH